MERDLQLAASLGRRLCVEPHGSPSSVERVVVPTSFIARLRRAERLVCVNQARGGARVTEHRELSRAARRLVKLPRHACRPRRFDASGRFRVLGRVGVTVDGEPRRRRPMGSTCWPCCWPTRTALSASVPARWVWARWTPAPPSTAIRVHVDRLRSALEAGAVGTARHRGRRLRPGRAERTGRVRIFSRLGHGREIDGRDPRQERRVARWAARVARCPSRASKASKADAMMRSYLQAPPSRTAHRTGRTRTGRRQSRWSADAGGVWVSRRSGRWPRGLVIALYRSGDSSVRSMSARSFHHPDCR